MKIGIDCRLAGPRHAGIGRYIQNLIVRLPVVAPDIEWHFYFSDSEQAECMAKELKHHGSNAKATSHLAPYKHYSRQEQLHLPRLFSKQNLDLLHVPHFNAPLLYKGKVVVTIHDLLWHEYKGLNVTTLTPWVYWIKYAAYRLVASRAITRATQILVPAETIKKTLLKHYPRAAGKVVVTKEGADLKLLKSELKTAKPAKTKKLLYVGSLYPHKNVELVLKALKHLPDYELVLIGSRNIFQDKTKELVKTHQVENQVTFAGYVADEKMSEYYQSAIALVQPSFSEGFGLTGVEAMAVGLPVLASNIPIFNEIYRDGALFFDPKSVDSFIKATQKLEQIDHSKLIAKAKKIVKQYSWDTMVEETVNVYRQCLS